MYTNHQQKYSHTLLILYVQELIGEPAGKLHTGRSRNDQVATDMRLWLGQSVQVLKQYLQAFIETMMNRAQR